ncbi:MAG: hypothetical protein H6867_00785 [Rhodospirillales bacterium]|nr:hypothetical protein [Rhodospirillales bacterium]MCB9996805.1 hypothetical protein [Rhodospirillales bacterium]
MSLLNILFRWSNKSGQPSTTFDPDLVVYAGAEADPASSDRLEFGFYAAAGQDMAVWLPGEATDPEVIRTLKSMPLGQSFRIAAEETVGSMGTLVTAIDVDDTMPVHDISNWESPVIGRLGL